jgi:hypothetical protein
LVGYCPAYLVEVLVPLLRDEPEAVHLAVERVNPAPAPLQHRLQCHLRVRTDANFHAYRSGRFEPLSADAVRLEPWVPAANVA